MTILSLGHHRGLLANYNFLDIKGLQADLVGVRERIAELVEELQPELDGIRRRLERIHEQDLNLYHDMVADLEAIQVDLSDYGLPAANVSDIRDALYDSRRDYLSQLAVFKAHKQAGRH